jgi:hypothetical protein
MVVFFISTAYKGGEKSIKRPVRINKADTEFDRFLFLAHPGCIHLNNRPPDLTVGLDPAIFH